MRARSAGWIWPAATLGCWIALIGSPGNASPRSARPPTTVDGFQPTETLAFNQLVWRRQAGGPLFACPILVGGQASYYADAFHGRTTAIGERYNRLSYSAAMNAPSFMGRNVCVVNARTGAKRIVRVNDTGRMYRRLIDLSWIAARDLGILKAGVAPVLLADPACCVRARLFANAQAPEELAEAPPAQVAPSEYVLTHR